MTACVNCHRTLQPDWKYCIYCGTRTAVTASIPRSRPLPRPASPGDTVSGGSPRASAVAVAELEPVPEFEAVTEAGPAERPDPPADPGPAERPGPPTIDRSGTLNQIAILALLMGALASPFAALFGHIALGQIRASGERGTVPAWIAVALGYLWLGTLLVLGIWYFVTNG